MKSYREHLASAIRQCIAVGRDHDGIAKILIDEGYVVDPIESDKLRIELEHWQTVIVPEIKAERDKHVTGEIELLDELGETQAELRRVKELWEAEPDWEAEAARLGAELATFKNDLHQGYRSESEYQRAKREAARAAEERDRLTELVEGIKSVLSDDRGSDQTVYDSWDDDDKLERINDMVELEGTTKDEE